MKCYICDKENWHILKEFTELEREMAVCKDCGNLVFLIDPDHENKVKEYYDKQYRSHIGIQNLITTTRKLNFIKTFLMEWLEKREKEKKPLIVGDVGCATGYLVDWFRRRGHKATGSEWTTLMRRFAEHYYNIPITEELEPKHKYDIITLYHTLEHMVEPDKKLDYYKNLLAEDGRLMVFIPTWLDYLEEPGMGTIGRFKDVYHKDHINIFTRQSIRNLFIKNNLVIEKERACGHVHDFILKRGIPTEKHKKENWEEIVKKIKLTKKALDHFHKQQFRDAINTWPKFPLAYVNWIYFTELKKDTDRANDVWKEAQENMPDDVIIRRSYGSWLYQHEQFEAALKEFHFAESIRPDEDILVYLGKCYMQLGKLKTAMNFLYQAQTIDPRKWSECMTDMCYCASNLLAWDEIAKEELKNKLLKESKITIKPNDPVFKEN